MSVKIKMKECLVLDENSVGLLLDFDGVKDPEKVVACVNASEEYVAGSLKFWPFVGLIIDILTGRKAKS